MAAIKQGILILTPFFSPNLGGVETHLDDLVKKLDEMNYRVYVHTYSPLTTPNLKWKSSEHKGKSVFIRRYSWPGRNLFHRVERFPFFDFLYLTPYLFLRTFFWLLFNSSKIHVIHAQGINAALAGFFLKLLFHKRLITSIHAIYEIDPQSATARLTAGILNQSDHVLALSKASYNEMISFGVSPQKLSVYTYWINLSEFKPIKSKYKKSDCFTVIFVGRLIPKKGVRVLANVAAKLPKIKFIFIGIGPEEDFLFRESKIHKNIDFIGPVPNNQLSTFYQTADLFCIPSQYEEGFGRVVMEAVACGLPVVGSNKGGIKEALDETVSILIEPSMENIKKAISGLYKNPKIYQQLACNTRDYALKHFSDKNIQGITKYYQDNSA